MGRKFKKKNNLQKLILIAKFAQNLQYENVLSTIRVLEKHLENEKNEAS